MWIPDLRDRVRVTNRSSSFHRCEGIVDSLDGLKGNYPYAVVVRLDGRIQSMSFDLSELELCIEGEQL